MKTWGSGGIAPPILASALLVDGDEWSALSPRKDPPVPSSDVTVLTGSQRAHGSTANLLCFRP
jgi:hypothetical protein